MYCDHGIEQKGTTGIPDAARAKFSRASESIGEYRVYRESGCQSETARELTIIHADGEVQVGCRLGCLVSWLSFFCVYIPNTSLDEDSHTGPAFCPAK